MKVLGLSHSSSSACTGGFSTFPTLQGLLRDHRAVPSLALDEISYEYFYILDDCTSGVKMAARNITLATGRF